MSKREWQRRNSLKTGNRRKIARHFDSQKDEFVTTDLKTKSSYNSSMNKSYVCFFLNTGRLPISTAWTLCLWYSFWRARDTRYSREPRTRGTHGHRRTTRSSWFYGTTRGQGRRRKARKPRPYRSTGTSRKNGTSRVHRP